MKRSFDRIGISSRKRRSSGVKTQNIEEKKYSHRTQSDFGFEGSSGENSQCNDQDVGDLVTFTMIESKMEKAFELIENHFSTKKQFAFNEIFSQSYNKAFETQLVKIKEAGISEEYKLKEKNWKLTELEDESIKLEKNLKLAGEERDELLAEVKHQEKIFGSMKIKDRSLEMVLIDKELTKYERENRDFKLKLDKKEKEVRRFMAEMNKI